MTDKEMFAVMAGMDEVNSEMDEKLKASAPICHFRKMNLEYSGWLEADYWECSVCGHTKSV